MTLPLTCPRSCLSSAKNTAQGCAPAALIISNDSRIAVPAVITSSIIAILPPGQAGYSQPLHGCLLGCPGQADRLEHYLLCPLLWNIARLAFPHVRFDGILNRLCVVDPCADYLRVSAATFPAYHASNLPLAGVVSRMTPPGVVSKKFSIVLFCQQAALHTRLLTNST